MKKGDHVTLRLRRKDDHWRLCILKSKSGVDDHATTARRRYAGAEALHSDAFGKAFKTGEAFGAEIAKSIDIRDEVSTGLALELSAGTTSERDEITVSAPKALVSIARVETILVTLGLIRRSRIRLRAALDVIVAFLVAIPMLFLDLLLRTERSDLPNGPMDTVLACHGAWETRTRHVLSGLGHHISPQAILVLGRPKEPLDKIAALWNAKLGRALPPLRRPFDLDAFWSSLGGIGATLLSSVLRPPEMFCSLRFSERVALTYRVYLGIVSKTWWARQRSGDVTTAVYGITGTADTNALELSMQHSGAKTVHLLHGLTTGNNMIGYSSLAICRSAHDARHYDAFGCYRRCAPTDAMPTPRLQRGTEGVALFSNLAHPMNPRFRDAGLTDELALLEDAAAVARIICPDGPPLLWKPHPIMTSLPEEQQREMVAAAGRLGAELVPADESSIKLAQSRRFAICSSSTIAVDMLSAGVLPLLHVTQFLNPTTSLAALPVMSQTRQELADQLASLKDDETALAAFTKAWAQVGPVSVEHQFSILVDFIKSATREKNYVRN